VGRTLTWQIPGVFAPLLQPSRYKGAYGGRGSGKSHVFAELLLERCLLRPTRAVCVREVQRSLEQSVKRLLEDKIQANDLGREFTVMNTHIETPGDGIIIFQGMQNHTAESIKSLEGYDLAWVEESQALSQRSLTLLRPTIRVPDSELWFSWNPRYRSDPVDAFFRNGQPPPNSIVVTSTFRDNPWFPDVLRTEMLWDRQHDIEKYGHIWLGEYEKHSDSRVFRNWTVEEFEAPEGTIFYHGGDWGFSADPTVLIRCFEQQPTAAELAVNSLARKKLFIDHEVYQIGCEIDQTAMLFDRLVCGCDPPRPCLAPQFHGSARQWEILADSARPETISYLQRHGYPRIAPAIKGPNSVKEGVIFLQGYDIVIHPRCVHTIDEFTMYSYKTDPLTSVVVPILEDLKNHVIDAVRYAIERLRNRVQEPDFVTW